MLHQISWFNYGATLVVLVVAYYVYVGLTYYRQELRAGILRLSGKKPVPAAFTGSEIAIPAFEVAGRVQPEYIEHVTAHDLNFGPSDEDQPQSNAADIHLLGEFSEMISEVKTLIRVINESSESKENFEMLFRLIVRKYHTLAGTAYETQVNDYLLNEGTGQFAFSLDLNELQNYWRNEDED